MTKPPTYAELRGKLGTAGTETERRLYFAAILREACGILPENFVVVGGSAIEIYTIGRYSSGDIDIVTDDGPRVQTVLLRWEFERVSRIWVNEDLGLVVDLVKPPYTGSAEKTTLMPTPFGQVRLAAVEDLFVKRLISTKFWKVPGDIEHAKMLALSFDGTMDWNYIESYARREDVLDLVIQMRAALRKRAGSKGPGRTVSS